MIKLWIGIAHAAFNEARRASMARLLDELRPQCDAHRVTLSVYNDYEAKGSLKPWLTVMERGAASDATHVCTLSDDSILVPHFVETLLACIKAKPEAILCMQSNHVRAGEVKSSWYTTPDGFTAFGGTMPREWYVEHLEWRKIAIREGALVQNDEGINLWAMSTGRLIHKAIPSLVDHDTSMPSLDGNDHHATMSPRRPVVFRAEDIRGTDWAQEPEHLGRSYRGNHWRIARDLKPEAWELSRMYDAARGGSSASETPLVFMAVPLYHEPAALLAHTNPSREAAIADLTAHGVEVARFDLAGESLISRVRQRIVHAFLKSPATHLLWWDADVECLDPTTVRRMLETGHDVIAGAYPFKDKRGHAVCNVGDERAAEMLAGTLTTRAGCIEVHHAGTGFMLVSRRALLDLMQRHPERLHWSTSSGDFGEPLWALYDCAIVDGTYLSEDYYFCHLWRQAGGKVHVYMPAKFRHWGLHGYEGSIERQYGLEVRP